MAATKALIAELRQAETRPISTAKERRARQRRLDVFFDFEYLSTAPLQPHKEHVSESQQGHLSALLKEAVRSLAYQRAGSFLNSGALKLEKPNQTEVKGEGHSDVLALVYIEEDDLDVELLFRWHKADGRLRLFDFELDGSSLVLDYQNQFGRIIAKEGAAELINKLRQRLDEAQGREQKKAKTK